MLTDLIRETINENSADTHMELALARAELAGAATSSATRDKHLVLTFMHLARARGQKGVAQ